MNNITTSKRIPNLTPIRFVLALLVVIFHITLFNSNQNIPFLDHWTIFFKGTEAVYMFFSLSGFLIIKQLYIEKQKTQSINLISFYKRRILRIFPLYYLILTFGFFYYQFILPYFGYSIDNDYNLSSGLLLSITFFSNIFRTYAPGVILEVLWSIGIEEQFYLLIAPLFLLLPVKRIIYFLGGFTLFYFLIYFSEYVPFLKKYDMLFFYFSFGGLCSILFNYKIFQIIIKKIRIPILLLFILYFTTSFFTTHLNNFYYNLLSCILFGLVIAALAIQPIKLLQNKPMNYLGKISYGIYMYHNIVIQFIGFVYLKFISQLGLQESTNIIIINFLVIIITIFISHISYKYYESYFLNLKYKTKTFKEKLK